VPAVAENSTDDAAAANKVLRELKSLRDSWRINCSARTAAEEEEEKRAIRLLTVAELRLTKLMGDVTKARNDMHEATQNEGKARHQCNMKKVSCNKSLNSSQQQAESIAASEDALKQVAEVVPGTTKLRRSLRGQADNLTNSTEQMSDACADHLEIIDHQLFVYRKENETAAGRLHFLLKDQEYAEEMRANASDNLDSARSALKATLDHCQEAKDNLTKQLEAVEDQRDTHLGDQVLASDCTYGKWTPSYPGGECSKSCGGGMRLVHREVIQAASDGGHECTEKETEVPCNPTPCPVDCKVSTWEAWSECSSTCDGGVRYRRRVVERPHVSSGLQCPLNLTELELCTGGKPCGKACSYDEVSENVSGDASGNVSANASGNVSGNVSGNFSANVSGNVSFLSSTTTG
jgi:hypothetical protein